MAAIEMYDYLSVAVPDAAVTFDIKPQRVLYEEPVRNQMLHQGDDDSMNVISLSATNIWYVRMQWERLSAEDAGTILDFWLDPNKGDGIANTFMWEHPVDGHTYVVRFISSPSRMTYKTARMGITEIKFKVEGVIADS